MAEQALNSTSKIPQQPGNTPPTLPWAVQQLFIPLLNPSRGSGNPRPHLHWRDAGSPPALPFPVLSRGHLPSSITHSASLPWAHKPPHDPQNKCCLHSLLPVPIIRGKSGFSGVCASLRLMKYPWGHRELALDLRNRGSAAEGGDFHHLEEV